MEIKVNGGVSRENRNSSPYPVRDGRLSSGAASTLAYARAYSWGSSVPPVFMA